jgi:hypothetical protein
MIIMFTVIRPLNLNSGTEVTCKTIQLPGCHRSKMMTQISLLKISAQNTGVNCRFGSGKSAMNWHWPTFAASRCSRLQVTSPIVKFDLQWFSTGTQ